MDAPFVVYVVFDCVLVSFVGSVYDFVPSMQIFLRHRRFVGYAGETYFSAPHIARVPSPPLYRPRTTLLRFQSFADRSYF